MKTTLSHTALYRIHKNNKLDIDAMQGMQRKAGQFTQRRLRTNRCSAVANVPLTQDGKPYCPVPQGMNVSSQEQKSLLLGGEKFPA